jgi:3'(2'), 5'-bisphosphate nucleotidase
MNDHALAARLATEAGRLLLGVREEFADADASERKAAGDKRSHNFLVEALANQRPEDAVLSEEGADDPVRLRSERVWIVDPLDGTREFSELGRDDWAVRVALWQAGELVAGAVVLPAQESRWRPLRLRRLPPRRTSRASWYHAPGRPPSR